MTGRIEGDTRAFTARRNNQHLWIQGLHEGAGPQVVYIPTEAGLPILEAGRIPSMRAKPAAPVSDDADRGALGK
jgi:hypothetical protein